MRRVIGRVSIAFAALVLIGVAASEGSAQIVPSRFKSEGLVALDGSGCIIALVGQASHLGRFSSQGCTPAVGPFIDGVAPFAGSITTTAVNGDMIFQDAVGTIDINSVPWVADGTFTITGGTGRFVGVSGSSSLHELIDPTDGSFVSSGSGTVSKH